MWDPASEATSLGFWRTSCAKKGSREQRVRLAKRRHTDVTKVTVTKMQEGKIVYSELIPPLPPSTTCTQICRMVQQQLTSSAVHQTAIVETKTMGTESIYPLWKIAVSLCPKLSVEANATMGGSDWRLQQPSLEQMFNRHGTIILLCTCVHLDIACMVHMSFVGPTTKATSK